MPEMAFVPHDTNRCTQVHLMQPISPLRDSWSSNLLPVYVTMMFHDTWDQFLSFFRRCIENTLTRGKDGDSSICAEAED